MYTPRLSPNEPLLRAISLFSRTGQIKQIYTAPQGFIIIGKDMDSTTKVVTNNRNLVINQCTVIGEPKTKDSIMDYCCQSGDEKIGLRLVAIIEINNNENLYVFEATDKKYIVSSHGRELVEKICGPIIEETPLPEEEEDLDEDYYDDYDYD